ncbi:glycosyltransferase family 4 protein [uncultured Arcticibacterium sp.]|uniref:glycosyltransferase family 4 protein n=1 Tax=uncultured Arcticibacterium sp. TaxID=2173042 RepID=UPI0030F71037
MKILIIHNAYKFKGGEDSVVEQEYDLLKSNGVKVDILKFDNDELPKNKLKLFASSIYNTVSYKRLHRKLSDIKPDVIHIHNLFYAASPSILYAAKELKVPVIMTVHNYRLVCNAATLLRDGAVCEKCIQKTFPLSGIKNACFQESKLKSAQLSLITGLHKIKGTWKDKVSKYIFLTDFAKQKISSSSLNLDLKKCTVKPNFVSDSGNPEILSRSNSYLFVGRLSKEKGVDILIEAFKTLPYHLNIIGTGPLEETIQAASRGVSNISFLGLKDKKEVIHYMKTSKALVFPSIWYEGMPMTILEAYSCGTPVISSDIDNINEIILNNKTGLHFKTGSHKSLSETIRRFEKIDNSYLYSGARKEYEEKYTSQKNYELLINIYEETINDYKNAAN